MIKSYQTVIRGQCFFSVLPRGPQDGQLVVALAFTLTSMTHLELTSVRGVHQGGQGLCAVFQGGLLSPLRSRKNRVTTLHPPQFEEEKACGDCDWDHADRFGEN